MTPMVLITPDELEALIKRAVAEALASKPEERAPERLTVPEVAAELRCSVRKVRKLLSLRQLRPIRMGGRVFLERSEVQRYLLSLSPRR